jgi:hypothetical protein
MNDGMRPEKRALLRELRRRQHVEWAHGQTPAERLAAAVALMEIAAAVGAPAAVEDPAEIWLALKARWRRLAG